jgi:prevent-host-death family protein
MTYWMNAQDAKTNLLKLVDAASAGEEVIIEREGVPTVRIVPYAAPAKKAPQKPLRNVRTRLLSAL